MGLFRISLVSLFFWWCIVVLSVAPALASSEPDADFHEWQLFELKTGSPISFESLKPQLIETDVIFIGEEHYTPSHVQAALKVLNALIEASKTPALAMEMFSWDGQAALDSYVLGEMETTEEFLKESHWKDNWGGDFSDYEPLIAFAKQHHVPVKALNPPRSLVRQVASKGLDQARADAAMAQWGMEGEIWQDDSEYRTLIFEQIEQCHQGLSAQTYERIFEASIFRDEGMAKVIADFLKNPPDSAGPLVSYTGAGHIQYGVPVPKRVKRRQSSRDRQVTLYLIAYDPSRREEIKEVLQEGIADFVWLTPLGPRGIQPRCG